MVLWIPDAVPSGGVGEGVLTLVQGPCGVAIEGVKEAA